MIGSDTFIIVALRCSESRTPLALASAIWRAKKSWSPRRLIIDAPTTSPSVTAIPFLRTVTLPPASVELDRERAGARDDRRLLVGVEVAAGHARDVRLGVLAPCTHRVRMCPGVVLDRRGDAPIGVPFTQHRIDRAPQHPGVPGLDCLLAVALRIFRIVGHCVALSLQLRDGPLQLRNRRADVRELDDVGVRRLRELAQLGEVVGLAPIEAAGFPESSRGCGRRERCLASRPRCRRPA